MALIVTWLPLFFKQNKTGSLVSLFVPHFASGHRLKSHSDSAFWKINLGGELSRRLCRCSPQAVGNFGGLQVLMQSPRVVFLDFHVIYRLTLMCSQFWQCHRASDDSRKFCHHHQEWLCLFCQQVWWVNGLFLSLFPKVSICPPNPILRWTICHVTFTCVYWSHVNKLHRQAQ